MVYRAKDLCPNIVLENRYTLIRQLGKGGFATVWEVQDSQAKGDRHAIRKAIKVCNSDRSDQIRRLRQEFWNLKDLQSHWCSDHRIVQVESIYPEVPPQEGDRPCLHFFVMEKIDGQTLRELVSELVANADSANSMGKSSGLISAIAQRLGYRYLPLRSRLTYPEVAHLLTQLAEVLHYLHSQHNYILRDLNPNNIMVTKGGEIKLIDFGTVRQLDQGDQGQYSQYVGAFDQKSVTRVITYGYAAPEQRDGQAYFRSDFYSLGQTMLFVLTGCDADEISQLPANWRSRIPWELMNFIAKATNTDPLKRHADSTQLCKEAQAVARSLQYQFGKGALLRQFQKILGIAAIAAFGSIGMRMMGQWRAWELAAYDQMLRMRPSIVNPHNITVVAIEPADTEWMGGRDVSHQNLAKAISSLLTYHPQSIGIAIARDQNSQDGLADMQQLLQKHDHIFGYCELQSPNSGSFPFQPKPLTPLGFSNIIVDIDDSNRRHNLFFIEDQERQTVDEKCPARVSFNLIIANHYLQSSQSYSSFSNQPNSKPSLEPELITNQLHIGIQKITNMNAEGAYHGSNDEGFEYTFQVLIDYQPINQVMTKVSMRDVIEGRVSPEMIRGKVVLIGRMDQSIGALKNTPYGAMYNIEMRSQVISYLIDLGQGRRRILQPAPWWLDNICIVAIALVSSFLSWRFPSQRDRLIHLISSMIIIWIVCYLILLWQSLWLGYVPFAIASILAIMGELAYTKARLAVTKVYALGNQQFQKISPSSSSSRKHL